MKLKTLYIRFYKAFNYDYLRKSHPDAVPDAWDLLGSDELFYPYVRIPLNPQITTVVGANESGKSQLIGAIKRLLTGDDIEPRDFCRYSDFFTVSKTMNVPEFGGEFCDLTDQDADVIRTLGAMGPEEAVPSFWLFRANEGCVLYVPSKGGPRAVPLKAAQVQSLPLPTYFEIDAKTPLPDSVPLTYLTSTGKAKRARKRKQVLAWFESLLENPAWFATKEALQSASGSLLEAHSALDPDDDASKELFKRLELAEKLLVHVAGIKREAFQQLQSAVRNHDGYANAIVAKMNEELAAALNFPKWWSQDSDFSLTLTLRDFDLVFTVRDKTGSEYAFSERSGGMGYFLSYFVQYLSHEPSDGQEILLMDEPDAYLSMLGQQDLLRIFEAFAQPDDGQAPIQVLYVTHSPFLIDKNHSERIRVLDKGQGPEGTRLVANAGRNHYEPLRSAFGAFVAETTFISNCNLMLEGQADQILLAGLSGLSRHHLPLGERLDLNAITLVPCGSAEHIPYMVYLARGRDVDTPAVIVLLDGDDAGDPIATELRAGYRGKRYLRDEFILRTSDVVVDALDIAVDKVREIEDLVPPTVFAKAVTYFANEVLPADAAALVATAIADLVVQAGDKQFKAAEALCGALEHPLRLDKVGVSRAILEVLTHDPDLARQTLKNFQPLLALINQAQRSALRLNGQERVSRTIGRHQRAFLRDHPATASRAQGNTLLEDIEAQLTEVTEETEAVRAQLRLLRLDFALTDEPAREIDDFTAFRRRLEELKYQGVRSVQMPSASGN